MKKYEATFFRENPQMKNGGYETTRIIEAKTIRSATKEALKIEGSCLYGRMIFKDIAEVCG